MYIEKNVFENIFNMVMGVKGKTKDNIKSGKHIALFCERRNMELLNDRVCVANPKATFALDKKA
jgi:hypothetical protein